MRETITKQAKGPCWHAQHDQIISWCIIAYRLAQIRREKPPSEVPLRERLLKPIQGVLPQAVLAAGAGFGRIETESVRAWDKFDAARDEYGRARVECGRVGAESVRAGAEVSRARAEVVRALAELERVARDEYGRARVECVRVGAELERMQAAYKMVLAANMPAILALHAIECPDCPWDGKTIFPKKQRRKGEAMTGPPDRPLDPWDEDRPEQPGDAEPEELKA